MNVFDTLNLIGTAMLAWSGILAGYKKNLDLFGAIVIGVITAIGGGTIRDLLIGSAPVFWVRTPSFLIVAVLTSIAAFFTAYWRKQTEKAINIADGAGLALFTVLATRLAIEHALTFPIALTVGVITGCFGGIIRDTLTNRIPYIFTRELYATASLAGSTTYWFLRDYPPYATIGGALVVLVLRYGSMRYGWSLPTFHQAEQAVKGATSGSSKIPSKRTGCGK